ncbi:VOC family protein [Azospirillum sp. ST 5-10]|uniref:VOC family protein n=1 Tax=unclassified Azospirillum TaxID=2630922 RepID=UPI003F4A3EDC
MSSVQGRFVWYELMTTDATAALAFYRDVVGWDGRDAGMPGMAYTILSAGEAAIGGLMDLPEEARAAGARPGWIGYVAVDDVDAAAAAVTAGGGAVHRAPADIPGVGRFAIVADPGGAVFALFVGGPCDGPAAAPPVAPPAAPMGRPGHVGWHELYAADREAAAAFYAGLFGWTKGDALDMGPLGIYQLFARDGETLGGMMTRPDSVPAPFWLYYVQVAGIDAAADRVWAGGGRILLGPQEVPGGAWIVQCLDPQGAIFALVGPRG